MSVTENRVALVTGASRGIGAATALALAKQGVHVVALARTVGGLEALDDAIHKAGGHCTLLPYDLLKGDLIEGLGPVLFGKFGRLDILVGNAAMLGGLVPTAQTDPATWDRVFALNVTANLRLIRTCDPLLRASDAGRAVFVTSGAAQSCKPFWGAYAASKAALEAMVKVYAAEVAHTNLKVNLLDPGRVRTAMRAEAYPGEDPMTLPDATAVAEAIVRLASPAVLDSGTRQVA
ncbi:MAG: SDR family NAD(P)-dependent oxidoreductase [Alphaproteobacteria bacterium]|nr:SDR family NAD(P)-dependent oxidoreductase [Alphaproteobacteria bacterium]